MSLILEALRKSEAERRRAVVPDLLAEPALAAPIPATTPQRWPLIAGGLAIAALLAWFAMRDRGPAPIPVVPVPMRPRSSSKRRRLHPNRNVRRLHCVGQ